MRLQSVVRSSSLRLIGDDCRSVGSKQYQHATRSLMCISFLQRVKNIYHASGDLHLGVTRFPQHEVQAKCDLHRVQAERPRFNQASCCLYLRWT
jgi:hypothetical protein